MAGLTPRHIYTPLSGLSCACPAALRPPNTNEGYCGFKTTRNTALHEVPHPHPVPAPAHPRLCSVLAGGRCCPRTARPRRPRPHATRGVHQSPHHHPLRGAQTNSTCSRTSPPTSRTCPGDPGPKPGCPPLSLADGPRAATDGPIVPPAALPIEGGGIPGRHCWSPATIRSTLAWPGTRYKRLQAGCMRLQGGCMESRASAHGFKAGRPRRLEALEE